MNAMDNSSVVGEESEDDFDWEEVEVGKPATLNAMESEPIVPSPNLYNTESHDTDERPSERPYLEITIKTLGKPKGDPKKNARAVQLAAERLIRLDCHKIHTVALLVNARIRNKWINDPLLHARLMSLTPLALQNAFTTIHRSRVPEAARRGQLFESAITRLADWWASTFEVVPTGHIRSRTFDEVQKIINSLPPLPPPDPKGKGKERATEEDEQDDEERYGIDGETVRSAKSLMKHALMRSGSRDTSAQLFTALCRALGIPARLVVSLQSVPWQAGVGKPKPTGKKKKAKSTGAETDVQGKGNVAGKATDGREDDDDEGTGMEEVDIPGSSAAVSSRGRIPFPEHQQRLDGANTPSEKGKGKQKATPVIRLRKSKGRKLGSTTTSVVEHPRQRERTPDPTTSAPVFWTEVFSRADARWIPVDPVRVIVNKRKAFDPTPNPSASTKPDRRRQVRVENRMVYVLAFEEDGYARDVTPRYAREYGAKVAKMQQGGKGRREWWEHICRLVARPYRLQRDDMEDEELQAHQMMEAMPTSMAGFKDHPLYVLSRHLKRDEVVEPPVELGKFHGEPVYPRGNVLQLKTAESWMRQGRTIAEGAQPLKWVKQRAVTVNKKRAMEVALADQRERGASESASASASVKGRADEDEDDVVNAGVEGVEGAGEGFASEDGIMQGMYAEHQTELYRSPPVVEGKIPKNDFGNLDLYVPTMLPAGAAHVPFKGTAKLARQLGFDYAEAVTGFEFKKRRAFPVVTGVVVAVENEAALLEAYCEAEQDAEAKRRAKREEQVLKRWTKLVQGLRIRRRLLEQYADRTPAPGTPTSADLAADNHNQVANKDPMPEKQAAGGFLTGVDDVVQPYALPRNLREIVEHASTSRSALGELKKAAESPGRSADVEDVEEVSGNKLEMIELSDDDDDDIMEAVQVPPQLNGAPRTMRELAEEAARRAHRESAPVEAEEELIPGAPPQLAAGKPVTGSNSSARTSRKATKSGAATPQARMRGMGGAASKPTPRATRKRRRAQVEGSDSEAGEVDEEESMPSPGPAKKTRTAAAVPASTRVLRTRKPKDASKVQEEKDLEDAYRRAVAE